MDPPACSLPEPCGPRDIAALPTTRCRRTVGSATWARWEGAQEPRKARRPGWQVPDRHGGSGRGDRALMGGVGMNGCAAVAGDGLHPAFAASTSANGDRLRRLDHDRIAGLHRRRSRKARMACRGPPVPRNGHVRLGSRRCRPRCDPRRSRRGDGLQRRRPHALRLKSRWRLRRVVRRQRRRRVPVAKPRCARALSLRAGGVGRTGDPPPRSMNSSPRST